MARKFLTLETNRGDISVLKRQASRRTPRASAWDMVETLKSQGTFSVPLLNTTGSAFAHPVSDQVITTYRTHTMYKTLRRNR